MSTTSTTVSTKSFEIKTYQGERVIQLVSRDFPTPPNNAVQAQWQEDLLHHEAVRKHDIWILDFTNVHFLGSTSINALIILDKRLKRKQCFLYICGLKTNVMELFLITRLHLFFNIRGTYRDILDQLPVP